METDFIIYYRGRPLAGFNNKHDAVDFVKAMYKDGVMLQMTVRYLDRVTWKEEYVDVWRM